MAVSATVDECVDQSVQLLTSVLISQFNCWQMCWSVSAMSVRVSILPYRQSTVWGAFGLVVVVTMTMLCPLKLNQRCLWVAAIQVTAVSSLVSRR